MTTPAQIGDYEILGLLGRGAMGAVYRGSTPTAVGDVAIKTVEVSSRRVLATIRREIRMLERVEHPNIVGVVDQGTQDGKPWYAMELVEGKTLRERRFERPTIEEMCRHFAQVCRGLAHLHSQGIVHRDLKPGNIVMRGDEAVIVDFGLASRSLGGVGREHFDTLSDSTGTPNYMAPEQVGGKWADARADLYALGCMIYESIYGKAPFDGNPPFVTMLKHANEDPEFGPTDHIELVELTRRLLQKSPDARPAYADEVADTLDRLAGTTSFLRRASPYLYRPNLVGRAEQVAWLRGKCADLHRHQGGVVSVTGEPGSGKTRLLIEALSTLNSTLVINGGAFEPGEREVSGAVSILTVVDDACRSEGAVFERNVLGSDGRVLASLHPPLAQLRTVAEASQLSQIEEGVALKRSYSALSDLLDRWSERSPIVVVFDDYEGLDEWAQGWIAWVADANPFETGRVLLVVGSQGTIAEESAIATTPLGHEHMTEMLESMLATQELPVRLVHLVQTRCEGNPLVVTELVRAMVEEGVLERGAGGEWWVRDEPLVAFSSVAASQTLGELHGRRLGQLSRTAIELAQVLAVFGESIEPSWFDGRVTDVDALLDAGIAVVSPRGLELANPSAVVRGLPEDRQRLHGIALRYLPAGEAFEERRALHLEGAGNLRAAQVSYLTAARAHRAGFQYRTSIRLFEKAASLAGGVEGAAILVETAEMAMDADLQKLALDLAKRAELFPGVRAYLTQARALASLARFEDSHVALALAKPRAVSPAEVAEVLLEMGVTCCRSGDLVEGRRCLEEAYAILEPLPISRVEVRTLMVMGIADQMERNYERANALFSMCLETAVALDDVMLVSTLRQNTAVTLSDTGQYDEAIALLKEVLEYARQQGVRSTEATALSNLGLTMSKAGRRGAAEMTLELAIDRCRKTGDRMILRFSQLYLAKLWAIRGNTAAAEKVTLETLEVLQQMGGRRNEFAFVTLTTVYIYSGKLDEAESTLNHAREKSLNVNDAFLECMIIGTDSHIRILRGAALEPELEAYALACRERGLEQGLAFIAREIREHVQRLESSP